MSIRSGLPIALAIRTHRRYHRAATERWNIERTFTTGYLACFDGGVIAHTTQPHAARAALQDYQQGLLEHQPLDVAQPVADLRHELVNGMHGAFLVSLIDVGYSAEAPDRVAAQRAQRAAEVRAAIVVERAACMHLGQGYTPAVDGAPMRVSSCTPHGTEAASNRRLQNTVCVARGRGKLYIARDTPLCAATEPLYWAGPHAAAAGRDGGGDERRTRDRVVVE
jgi:hypothetical protein